MRKAIVFLLASILLAYGYARATVFGTVRGIVHDPQHRPISGASVEIRSQTSDWSASARTSDEGEFSFSAVALADYSVTVTASGFAAEKQALTLNSNIPCPSYFSANIYYGSGFSTVCRAPSTQTPYLPGNAQIDLAAGKEFGERFSVGVNATNIADRHLLVDNSLTFGGFHYNNPRAIYVELRYRFHY